MQIKDQKIAAKTLALAVLFGLGLATSNPLKAENSGAWVANGSGSNTTWTTSAGAIDLTLSATDYGSGTGFTLNDFQVNDTMACSGAYSDPSIVGNPSLSIRNTYPDTASITIEFSEFVTNPVLHLDRLGGGGGVGSTTTSALISIATPGISFQELSQNDVHFQTSATSISRQSGIPYTQSRSECDNPLLGTAAGSVRLVGTFNSVTLNIGMDPNSNPSGTVNDRWEIAFSDIFVESDIVVSKTNAPDTQTSYTPGQNSSYQIRVRNQGPSSVAGVEIDDALPRGVTLRGNWSCSVTNAGTGSISTSCPAVGGTAGDSDVALTADLANGAVITINVPVIYSADPADY